MKNLVAYFSCTGTTERLAKTLASAVQGDLYRIEPAVPYTAADLNWNDPHSRSSVEMNDKQSRPALAGGKLDLSPYGTVFLGAPIWWGVAPTLVNSFLEAHDFSGKVIVPFATSGGSEATEADRWLHPSCSKTTQWRPAKRFSVDASAEELLAWIEGLAL
jgi:flavodoxin